MDWLNYHHLLYFWTTVQKGSLTRAASELRLSPSTVSAQIHTLENLLGQKLFERRGRNLVLTDVGHMVARYAEEIFALGRELLDTMEQRPLKRPLSIRAGIADVIPKLVAFKLLEPLFSLKIGTRLICREDKSEKLLAELAVHELDVVISDAQIPSSVKIKGYNHLLGSSDILCFGEKSLAAKYKKGFPPSLDGAPILLPSIGTALRQSLDQWFSRKQLRPMVIGEFDDSALLKVFGQLGKGIFVAPAIIRREVIQQCGVREIGIMDGIRESYYAISVERHIKHPGVVAVCEQAKSLVFASKQ